MSATGKKMTLRVQSPEGTQRVEAVEDEAAARLYERVRAALRLRGSFALCRDRQRRDELAAGARSLRDEQLRHGDMLYLLLHEPRPGGAPPGPEPAAPEPARPEPGPSVSGAARAAPPSPAAPPAPAADIVEDDVDIELYKQDGKIYRERDPKLCQHSARGRCVHCAALEPWDAEYLRAHHIQHASFHARLRQLAAGAGRLSDISCKIKPGCTEHPPWPRGVCSRCQPPALTLARQGYRHVDNVTVDSAAVDRFLQYWRLTGDQRIGILFGTYELHPDVPLGIRARVSAIYEPEQTGTRDSVSLAAPADAVPARLAALAARLGLRPVGWIFTDLLPAPDDPLKVQCTRGVDTHFLSAQECITAAYFQNKFPNPCRAAPTGYYGSKFVTVCATGDAEQQVHLEAYQVSEQCQALVRDDVLVPTRDAPELAHVRPGPRYVPPLHYSERDQYGNEVSVSTQRVPVAFLLLDVPVGGARGPPPAPRAPSPRFPPAHRRRADQLQTLTALHDHIERADSFLEAMSDLHVLYFLMTNSALPLDLDTLEPLLQAVRAGDHDAAAAWRRQPAPATLEQLAQAAPHQSLDDPGVWTCALCTFHNAPTAAQCDMCAMPRNNAM